MDVSKNRGTLKSSLFNRVFHYKLSILGYPYFWETLGGLSSNKLLPTSSHFDGQKSLVLEWLGHYHSHDTIFVQPGGHRHSPAPEVDDSGWRLGKWHRTNNIPVILLTEEIPRPTTWDVENLVNNGKKKSTAAGFLPSTVCGLEPTL